MIFRSKICRVYAACGVSQTPNDPYEYEEAMQSVVERLEEDSVDDHVYTYEEMRELIGDDGAFRD